MIKAMKKPLFAVLIAGALTFSCPSFVQTALAGKSSGNKASNITRISSGDAAMNAASAKARATLKQFLAALKAPKKGQENFGVKKRFPVGKEGGEHMWLGDIAYDGLVLRGTLINRPVHLKNVHYGDRVVIHPNEVSDWLYSDNGKMVGGYTMRVLHSRLSPGEKKRFEEGLGMRF